MFVWLKNKKIMMHLFFSVYFYSVKIIIRYNTIVRVYMGGLVNYIRFTSSTRSGHRVYYNDKVVVVHPSVY